MTSRRRGTRDARSDGAAPRAKPLFPEGPDAEPVEESATLTTTQETPTVGASWSPPPAQPYLAPELAPEPMRSDAAMDDPDLPYWLALNRVKGIGPARFTLLLDACGSARAAWEASPMAWRAAGLDERTVGAFERQRRAITPEAELARLLALRVGALRVIDPGYPRLLREIPAPPPVIYVRGRLTPEDELAIGVVGTRQVSAYGRHVTERLAGDLAAQRVTIVSGLARGVDTHAHTAALDAGGRTIAVLGCGPDLVYPPDNARLAARIVEQGAVVTEFPPGTQPDAGNFPARNRIISGLSLAVLVTEAPEASGALITARFAAEQGRDIFAVPGNITGRGSAGANRLIQDGAKLILTAEDALAELNLNMAPQQIELRELLPEDETEAALIAGLRAAGDPQHIDDLCRATGLAIARVSGALAMMELKGMVSLVGPMTYALSR
ncbi:MAG TPA: DNA-processing protein DprA [Ktedonobacterales bacterium]